MSGPASPLTLAELWPYHEISISPQLAALPLEAYFSDAPPASVTAANWRRVSDPGLAPRASYALRLCAQNGTGNLARWAEDGRGWTVMRRFDWPSNGRDCIVIELDGIVLGTVGDAEALADRVKSLVGRELSAMTVSRLAAMAFSIMGVMLLYFSIRAGAEMHAAEPFVLIFSLAVVSGLTGAGLKARARSLLERGQLRVRQQFQYEYRSSSASDLRITDINATLRDLQTKREEAAVASGFLLLLCFVYFVAPIMVASVLFALIMVTLITGASPALKGLAMAYDRAEQRFEYAALSYRASNDDLSTPALRDAKKQVLRDRSRRHNEVRDRVQSQQGRKQLNQDLGQAVAFLVIFGTYAMAIASGLQKPAPGIGDSLVVTSLFSVAPIIVLISISKSTTAMALVVNRRFALLAR